MAEELDVLTAIALQAAPIAVAASGVEYQLVAQADIDAYGLVHQIPNVAVHVGQPLLRVLSEAHDRGDAFVAYLADKHDAPVPQPINDQKRTWKVSSDPIVLTFTQAGGVVTLAGALRAGNVIGFQFDGKTAAGYAITPADVAGGSLLAVAQEIAAIVSARGVVTVAAAGDGGTATLTFARTPTVRTGAPSVYARIVNRRKKEFAAFVWATTWHARAEIARRFESSLKRGQRLAMPDGTTAKVVAFDGTNDFDEEAAEGFYVRRIRWTLEWSSVETYTATPVVAMRTSLTAQAAGVDTPRPPLTASLL